MLKKMIIQCLACVSLLSLSACVGDEAHRLYLDGPLPAKKTEEVLILFEEPDRPYTVIADLQARGASPDYMQRESAKIGADAVICSYLGGRRNVSDKWADQDTSKTYRRMAGTAIIFIEK